MKLRLLGLTVAATLALAGCGSAPQLPDETDPGVQADTQHVADVVAADLKAKDEASSGPVGEWVCLALLLGRDHDALLASVNCAASYDGVPGTSGMAGPVRVEGTKVRYAADGAGYADSVHQMFGHELGDYYLDQ